MAREIYVEEGYRVAPLFRRFVAGVVDLAFAFLFSMLLFLVIYPHGNWGTLGQAIGMSETWDTLNVYRASSGLMQDKDGNILPIISPIKPGMLERITPTPVTTLKRSMGSSSIILGTTSTF